MIEDDIYRTSSQYRLWSYTPEKLHQIRVETNSLAAEKVKAAFKRARFSKSHNSEEQAGEIEQHDSGVDIDTLTVDEELKIIQWGCSKIIDMGEAMEPRIPPNIVATAIQFLRRFYLTNSPMTYHPKQIMLCALFLATKAEHFYVPINKFVSSLSKVTADDIRAPEFLLMQGLRFTLDVRHPMRGLEGGVSDMQACADMAALKSLSQKTKESLKQRIGTAADKSKTLLRTAAQMTDAYFLFTPSQIWLSAMMVSDEDLTLSFIDHIFERLGTELPPIKQRLINTISSCAELLKEYKSAEDDKATRSEITRIGKKLKKCQDPEKVDIIAVARAKAAEKREGSDSDADKALKKRKLQRERLESDRDVFGPDIQTVPPK